MLDEADDVGADVYPWPGSLLANLVEIELVTNLIKRQSCIEVDP